MTKKKQWNGQDFLIGEYQLGYRMVDLWAIPNNEGGSCNLCMGNNKSWIKVGMDYDHFDRPYMVLFHEVMELCMIDLGVSYKPLAFEPDVSDVRHFMYNHNQHTEIASRTSWFIMKCNSDFHAAFKTVSKWRKSNK